MNGKDSYETRFMHKALSCLMAIALAFGVAGIIPKEACAIGDTQAPNAPEELDDRKVIDLQLERDYSGAVLDDGSLWMWGRNSGQLGDGTTTNRNVPTCVMEDGVKSVAFGYDFAAAVKEDGSLWTWGKNYSGQLGVGGTADSSVPTCVMEDGVKSVALGYGFAAAVKEDGSLWMWGGNDSGQLGDGTSNTRYKPVEVIGEGVKEVYAGSSSTAVVMDDGSLWTWGDNDEGQLGDGTNENRNYPVKVIDGDVRSVSWDGSIAAVIKSDGSLWAWGHNTWGHLGDGTTESKNKPVQIFSSGVKSVSMPAYGHGVAVMEDGSLWAWGPNGYGQLGNGTTEGTYKPIKIIEAGVKEASVGFWHTAAVMSDGTLLTWGSNYWGELGNGTNEDSHAPVKTSITQDVAKIELGMSCSAAVKADGSLWMWGQNEYGKLGFGKSEKSNIPVRVIPGNGSIGDNPEEPMHNSSANDPLAHLAACELSKFQTGNGFEGSTVSDFLDSQAFTDEKIWDGLDNTYGDFFASTIGGYEIVRARLYGDSPYIALKNPDTGDVIFAVASVTANGTSLDITSTEVQRYFDEVASNLAEVESAEPNATIYLTGSGTGGQAAAYASSATGMEATTFNAAPGFGARLALITQAPLLTGNEFRGVGDSACVNYYNASRENAYSYGKDILPSMAVSNNSAGSEYQLNGLYRYKDGAYEMQPVVQNTIENRMLELSVANVDDIAESIARTAHSAFQNGSAEIDLSFEEIGEDYAQVVLGTSGMDKFVPGDPFRGELFNWLKKQVCYTGAGDGDFFKGGTTSDVFVAGEGESQLIGGEGADFYVVGDNANVKISDTGAKDGNQMIDGAFGVLKLIMSQGADGGADALEAIAKLLLDTDRDTVVLKNCGFDDMKVALVKGSALFGWDDHYVITAGASTVEIPAGRADDLAVVDSSARTMTVEQLYGEGERSASYAAMRDAATGASDEGGYVTLDMMGNDLKVEIVDVSTGEVLDTLDSTESMDLYMDNGAFSSFPEVGLITGAYDSSKIKVQMVGGDFERAIANKNVDDVKGALIYADGFAVSQNETVEVMAEGSVSFVKVTPDGERAEMETGEVTNTSVPDDEDEPDVPSTPEEPDDPSVPSQPSWPSGDVSGEAHASKAEFDASKGNVTVTPESAKVGEGVTVTTKPLFGFEVSSVAVTSGGDAVDVVQGADGAWTFEMPDGDVSVSVEFVPTAWDNPFADVGEDDWFYDAIRRANLAGLMNGYDGVGLFGPDDGLKREQAATVMWNLMGRDDTTRPAATHSDVVQGEWYAPQVNWAVDAKVMDGYDAGTFGVGDELTREQFAAVIAKAVGADVDAADATVLSSFPDSGEASEWARQTLAWAVENGVINGAETESGRELQPTRTLTRAEMATMMMNAIDKGVLELALG